MSLDMLFLSDEDDPMQSQRVILFLRGEMGLYKIQEIFRN